MKANFAGAQRIAVRGRRNSLDPARNAQQPLFPVRAIGSQHDWR